MEYSTVISDFVCTKHSLRDNCNIQRGKCQCQCFSTVSELEVFHSFWVVLTSHSVPHLSSINFWQSREDCVLNRHPVKPQMLLTRFQLIVHETVNNHKLEIVQDGISLTMVFVDLEKFMKWHKTMFAISSRVYAEIVRLPTKPTRERQYIVEMTPKAINFHNSKSDFSKGPEFSWNVESVCSAKYDNKVGKLQVDVTCESTREIDKYSLIGLYIKDLYLFLKNMYYRANPISRETTNLVEDDFKVKQFLSIKEDTLRSSSDSNLTSSFDEPSPKYVNSPKITEYHQPLRSKTGRRFSEPSPPPLPPRPTKMSRSPSLPYQGKLKAKDNLPPIIVNLPEKDTCDIYLEITESPPPPVPYTASVSVPLPPPIPSHPVIMLPTPKVEKIVEDKNEDHYYI